MSGETSPSHGSSLHVHVSATGVQLSPCATTSQTPVALSQPAMDAASASTSQRCIGWYDQSGVCGGPQLDPEQRDRDCENALPLPSKTNSCSNSGPPSGSGVDV